MTYERAIEVLEDGDWYTALPPQYTDYSDEAIELVDAIHLACEALANMKNISEAYNKMLDDGK